MQFEILSEISEVETFAAGSGIREMPDCGTLFPMIALPQSIKKAVLAA
jgi:hypothetical protein